MFGRICNRLSRRHRCEPLVLFELLPHELDLKRKILDAHREILLISGNRHEAGLETALLNGNLDWICGWYFEFKTPLEQAAYLLESIATSHPFVDGNKRAAFTVAGSVLEKAGYHLKDVRRTYEFIRSVAEESPGLDAVVIWLRENCVSSPSGDSSHRGGF